MIRFQKHNGCCPDNVWMTLLYELNLQCYLTENN